MISEVHAQWVFFLNSAGGHSVFITMGMDSEFRKTAFVV